MPNGYTHVLGLEETKKYLRLEIDFVDDDSDIERMIASALGFIEKKTNHVFKVQDKTYYKGYFESIDVYDFPINTTEYPDGLVMRYYPGFIRFTGKDSVTINVGYASRDDVPQALIDCALQMIKVFYYEAEKNANTTLLPEAVHEILNAYRRFTAC